MDLTRQVEKEEAESAMKRMKNNKAVGHDSIRVEAWQALGKEGVDILWGLVRKIEEQEVIPQEWRDSIMVPIFKKEDDQNCELS